MIQEVLARILLIMYSNASETAERIINSLIDTFGDAVSAIVLDGVIDTPSKAFYIEYVLYNYFCMRFNYDRGHFGSCIVNGENAISIQTEIEWDDECDYIKYWKAVKDDIRLRIPDKYLEKHGW